jgi:hypothetical protein
MVVDLRLQLGKLPCHVHLERNGAARRRYISVAGSGSAIELDFSSEPGIIHKGADSLVADPDWDHSPRPLAEMLGSFLAAAGGAPADPRLDLGPALHACALSDSIWPAYLTQLGEWLSKALANRVSLDDELRYALSEILYGGRRLGEDELDEHFRRLHSVASGAPGSNELSLMIRSLTHRNGGKSTAESAAARDQAET